jgi:antitoxin component HigA of HigAB toxin-antitoxin module
MQTHAQAAYLAGAIVCELEARGYAGKDGFSPAAMGNISRQVNKLSVYARHCWAEAAKDSVISEMMGEFQPPESATPVPEQGCFWIGYYHQKIARDLPATLPEKIASLIDATGLSVNAFCEKHKLSQSSIQSYVAGKSRPTWDKVQELAKALGVSTDVFRDK